MRASLPSSFEIEGHQLTYPTRFRDGSSMMALFAASARRVQEVVSQSSPFVVSEVFPRRAIVGINCVHYTDTDCGRYEEIALSVFVEPVGVAPKRIPYAATLRRITSGTVPSYTWLLGVNTTLSRDCGIQMWGFPKQLADLRFSQKPNETGLTWSDANSTVLELAVPRSGSRTTGPLAPPVYSMIDGKPHVGYLQQSYSGVGYHRRGVQFTLGQHPIADQLRRLKLSRRPFIAVSNAHLEFEMSAPQPLPEQPSHVR